MSAMSRILIVTAASMFLTAANADTKGPKIAKCQDTQGRWHYGDTAAAACAQSKIEVMNDQGLRIKEVAAPPTAAELKAQEESRLEAERKKQRAEEQKKKDDQLLANYGHEDDIGLARERKLTEINAQMDTMESTLMTLRATLTRMQAQAAQEQRAGKPLPQTAENILRTESQIAKQEAAMQEREREKETVKQRYAAELARYREIKGIPVSKTAGNKN